MGANPAAIPKLVDHYRTLMYHSILTCMKNSFNLIKARVGKTQGSGLMMLANVNEEEKPFLPGTHG